MARKKAARATEETVQEEAERWLETSSHLAALCGVATELDDHGRARKQTYFCYTGFLVEVSERWYMVTAGHCLKDLKNASASAKMRFTDVALIGGFRSRRPDVVGVPFYDYAEAPCNAVFDKAQGFDYGWIEIRQFYRNFLEQEGAQPIPLIDLIEPPKGQTKGFLIFGFPAEFVRQTLSNADVAAATAVVERVMISANAIDPLPDDIAMNADVWFIAQLNQNAPLKSAGGLSGGPIVEVSLDGRELHFRTVALQSWWLDKRRIVFGCRVSTFVPIILHEIQRQQGRTAEASSAKPAQVTKCGGGAPNMVRREYRCLRKRRIMRSVSRTTFDGPF